MFDIRTLLFIITLVLVARAAVLVFVWLSKRDYQPLQWWALGSVLVALGTLLIGMRAAIPLSLSVLGGQALVLGGWLLIDAGIVEAAQRRVPWRVAWAIWAMGMLGVLWFQLGAPHYGLRTMASTVPGLVFDGAAAWACLQVRGGRSRRTLRVLGFLALALLLSNTWKAVYALVSGQTALQDPGLPVLQFYVVSMLYCVAVMALFVLLAAHDVQDALDRDIERRMVAEKSMEMATLVYENTSEGMLVTDVQGTILTVNPAFMAMTGYSRQELIGENPRLLQSGRHTPEYYRTMWDQLGAKGAWSGELWNRKKNGDLIAVGISINTIFDLHGRPQKRVALVHDITKQKQAEDIIYQQAHYDTLTGLPNRNLFFKRLASELSRARRQGERLALMAMDLNRFKPVNDQYGHEAGDWVLKTVSQRWQAVLRETDTLARVGGDEFVLIAVGFNAGDDVRALATKLQKTLEAPVVLPAGTACSIGASIGVAFYPDHALEMDALMAAADAAMYSSKQSGAGQWVLAPLRQPDPQEQGAWMRVDPGQYSGYAPLDQRNADLVRQINALNRVVATHRGQDASLQHGMQETLDLLQAHTQWELQNMQDSHYPQAQHHMAQHAQLMSTLLAAIATQATGVELQVLQTVKDWLNYHMQHFDKPLGAYLSAWERASGGPEC